MLFWLLTLAVAVCAIYVSHELMDEETRFPLKLIGLFSLFLSLVYSPWLIKLSIVLAIMVTPVRDRQHYYLRRVPCSPSCIARSNCRNTCC
ncbi:MAG: hypothetical protein MUE44_15605 [Oscillatoriaceae cyanobacterium Prado104]|jgi:hypothetical protein|nr:hypothetical protein [Oscillatoriaceae cyanobacterium Prado104]